MIPEDTAAALRVASDVARILRCNVMVVRWDRSPLGCALVIKVGVDEVPTQEISTPLRDDMTHDEIVEAVAQQAMCVLPMPLPDRPDTVRICIHRWGRSKLASGPEGCCVQCTRCHVMGDMDSTGAVTLWTP